MNLRIFEAMALCKIGTSKPRNQEANKRRHEETKKTRNHTFYFELREPFPPLSILIPTPAPALAFQIVHFTKAMSVYNIMIWGMTC